MQALGCLGNVLWFFPFGLGTGLLWCIAGVFCFISIIGIPWGRACFVMAGFAFMPFGRMPVSRDVLTGEGDIGTGPLGTVGNIVWLLLCGIWIACGHLLSALACAVTIIGIPFGLQCFKAARLSFLPQGKRVVLQFKSHPVANVFWVLIGGSLVAMLNSYLLRKIFKKYFELD